MDDLHDMRDESSPLETSLVEQGIDFRDICFLHDGTPKQFLLDAQARTEKIIMFFAKKRDEMPPFD